MTLMRKETYNNYKNEIYKSINNIRVISYLRL